MLEWKKYDIENIALPEKHALATGPFGSAISSRFFRDSGVPVIRGSNLSLDIGKRLVEENLVYLDEEKAQQFDRSRATKGDLVFTCWGTVGQVGLIDERASHAQYIVSNKQMKLTPNPELADSLYLYYALSGPDLVSSIQRSAIGSSVPGFNLTQLRKLSLSLPPLPYQIQVAALLGALDDKIAVNMQLASTARELALVHFGQALRESPSRRVRVKEVTQALTRGIAPKYTDDPDELIVINQKCIRCGRVSLSLARRTLGTKVPSAKLLQVNDVVVNSTGVGTLGRVARWTSASLTTTDSHVTIVRFDPEHVDPVFGGFAMLAAQSEIESMGEGSTGQTELSRQKLGGLHLDLPTGRKADRLRPLLEGLEESGEGALAQNLTLAGLRDTLLPKLVSGELRIRDAEEVVEDAV
jgi:type I restriction enzyme S subunit